MRVFKSVVLGLLYAVALSALVLLTVGADWGSWSSLPVFAHAISFPYALGIFLIIVALGVLLVLLLMRRLRWPLGVLSGIWLLCGAWLLIFPENDPFQARAPTAAHNALDPQAKSREITVVSFNTQRQFSTADAAEIVQNFDPDIIVLSETTAEKAREALAAAGFKGEVYDTPKSGFPSEYSIRIGSRKLPPTPIAVSERLGSARVVDGFATTLGTTVIEFSDASLPAVAGVHTAPPTSGLMYEWNRDLRAVVKFAGGVDKPLIMAGDFNATTRHFPLTHLPLSDAAAQCGGHLRGTWPSDFRPLFRTQIDHVFVSSGIRAHDCRVQNIGDSDHAAFITKLTVPGR